jgi:hypothetical protein
MSESKKKILEMLAQGKINADEAYRLLSVVDGDEGAAANAGHDNTGHDSAGCVNASGGATRDKAKPKYLYVKITPGENREDKEGYGEDGNYHHHDHADKVNIRVPMALIRSGIKMKSLIPPDARDKIHHALHDKGIEFDIDSIKPENIEELVAAMDDMEIDVEGGHGENIKVHLE